jgi:arylsulfatase A-like enzyme
MRKRLRSAVGLALALAACSGPPAPHVVLVTADALRADHLSLYGYPRQTSPRLDAFARDASVFAQAISVIPKTAPSFATIFTGRHPEVHGVRSNFASLPAELPLLPERLRAAGYRTAAFVSNPALGEAKGFARGFDVYRMLPADDGVAQVNRAFIAFAEEPWSRPTFVWLHYIDPHGPYQPPLAYEELFLGDEWSRQPARVRRGYDTGGFGNKVLGAVPGYQQRADGEDRVAAYVARYDAEIRYVDDAFGEVLDTLRAQGVFDAAAIVFTSDHGESLGEHDLYFEHGWFAYDSCLRVPLVIKAPGQRGGRASEAPVSNLDLLPTLLGLAGVPSPDAGGADLLREPAPADPILVESSDRYPEKFHGARTPRWKYLRRESDGREELYDLTADPAETRNLAASQADARRQLADFTAARRAELRRAAAARPEEAPVDPATLDQLRRLGYVE